MTSTTQSNLNSDLFVSLVLPCFNVEGGIRDYICRASEVLSKLYSFYEIILVDANSTDATVQVISSCLNEIEGLRLIQLSKYCREDVAASVGIDSAIGDAVIVLSTRTDDCKHLPEIVKLVVANNAVVYGKPLLPGSSFRPLRWVVAKMLDYYCSRYLKVDIQRGASLMRGMTRNAANHFTQIKESNRSIRLMTANLGMKAIPYAYQPLNRPLRRSMGEDINLALDILVSTSNHPMRVLTRLALGVAFLNVVYAGYVVTVYLIKAHVAEGWVTLSLQNAAMFFLLFNLLALLAEYVGKILIEVQDRPAFSAFDEKTSTVLLDPQKKINVYKDSK
jgi:hypothetical protein